MGAAKKQDSFVVPAARPLKQIWITTYSLTRQEFLDAVEEVISRVAHPIEGLHWEYEGFRRYSLFIYQPADEERSIPASSVTLGLDVDAESPKVTLSVNSSSEVEVQLFRRLVTELDGLPHVASACLTPCSFIATQPPSGSPDWFNGRPSGVGVFVALQPQVEGEV